MRYYPTVIFTPNIERLTLCPDADVPGCADPFYSPKTPFIILHRVAVLITVCELSCRLESRLLGAHSNTLCLDPVQ
jgi:hypothetical protein